MQLHLLLLLVSPEVHHHLLFVHLRLLLIILLRLELKLEGARGLLLIVLLLINTRELLERLLFRISRLSSRRQLLLNVSVIIQSL